MAPNKKRFRLKTKTEPGFMTVQETAAYLGVSSSTVRRYMRENNLPFLKPAGRIFIERKKLDEWIRNNNAYENPEADKR